MARPDQEYVHPSTDAESKRLEKQARLYGGTGFLEPFLAQKPGAILETGCGTGYFVRHAAGRVVAYELIHDAVWFSPPKPAFTRLLKRTIDVLREQGAEPDQGLHLPSAMKRAGLEDVGVQVIPNSAMSPDPLYESYRENWQATVTGLSETLGSKYEEGLAEKAQQDLETRSDHDFLVEITVLSHGRKA